MNEAMTRVLNIPKGVPTSRYRPQGKIEVPANQEVPLFSKDAPPDKQLQKVWTTRVKMFDMSKPEDEKEVSAIWQRHTDEQAVVSQEKVEFFEGRYMILLRWADYSYKLPT